MRNKVIPLLCPKWVLRLAILMCLFGASSTRTEPAQVTSQSARDKVRAYESSCVATLRLINLAQGTYWGGDPKKGYARTLRELGPAGAGILDAAVTSGKKDGYRFRLIPKPVAGHGPITRYTMNARPIKRLFADQRSFFSDESGVIHFTTEDRLATVADPPLDSPSRH